MNNHLFVKFACCSFRADRTHKTDLAKRSMDLSLSRSGRNDRLQSHERSAVSWMTIMLLASITGASPLEVGANLRKLCANYRKLFSIAHRVAADNSMLVNYNQLTVPVISSVLRFSKSVSQPTRCQPLIVRRACTRKRLQHAYVCC